MTSTEQAASRPRARVSEYALTFTNGRTMIVLATSRTAALGYGMRHARRFSYTGTLASVTPVTGNLARLMSEAPAGRGSDG